MIKKEIAPGDAVTVLADCPTFESEVRKQWPHQWPSSSRD
ncbi:MAG: hypothetical protein QG622_728 [Actinomycetota bacterium]|nr:hypothetical protein [Actinomycetota bacterium]